MSGEVFVGIDVCKPRLDVVILPTGEVLTFENTPKGISRCMFGQEGGFGGLYA